MQAALDDDRDAVLLTEAGRPVLRYRYRTVPIPEDYFTGIPKAHLPYARKYAQPRGDYIHPLYGLDGQELTVDWPKDHAHHRGIYWAWPEVMYHGALGDLHALQVVFARPTGKIETRTGKNWAEIEAESRWMWEDKTPIVREVAVVRAWQADGSGRHVDLTLRFEALVDGVSLARRGTNNYGGLNMRLAKIADMNLAHHADPADSRPRVAWQMASGKWAGSDQPAAVAVFEKATNPGYPGDYVRFPNLPWFQPTFPARGTRHELKKGEPLELRFRLWISRGAAPTPEELARQWRLYNEVKP